MNLRKIIFLFLALLLPILIFLFLKTFGKNEFEVTPLFQDSVSVSNKCNGFEYAIPYTIADTVFSQIQSSGKDVYMVIVEDSMFRKSNEPTIQLGRVFKEFSGDKLASISIRDGVGNLEREGLKKWSVRSSDLLTFKECVFLLDDRYQVALVDSAKRIVGQYDLSSREDTDRLILELKILLKKY